MSQETHKDISPEDIQNMAQCMWYQKQYQMPGTLVGAAQSLHQFLVSEVGKHTQGDLLTPGIEVISGSHTTPYSDFGLECGFSYLKDEDPSAPTILKRYLKMSWENSKWNLVIESFNEFSIIRVRNEGKEHKYIPFLVSNN